MEENTCKHMVAVDELNEGVAIFRYKGKDAYLEYANAALCSLLHFSFEQLKGAEYAAILASVHPDDVDELWKMIKNIPETKSGTCTYRFKDFETGELRWLTASGKYIEEEAGDVAYFLYYDITLQQDTINRERLLVICLQLITADSGWEENIEKVVEYVQIQYQSDRAYIFEFDWEHQSMSNRWEFTAEYAVPEIQNLQNMPVECISHWLGKFHHGEPVFIDDLEAIKDNADRKDEYDVLVVQDIKSLMVVPILRNGNLFAYIGVDNPAIHKRDKAFLSNIAQILSQEYLARLQQERLMEMSLRDPLTNLNNRHAYNFRIDGLKEEEIEGIGVLFSDVNGLKYINDHYGHVEGDKLIQRAVEILEKYFDEQQIYRISGDEFVVIVEGIEQNTFETIVERLKLDVSTLYSGIFAVGRIWKTGRVDIRQMIREAEESMYQDKKLFYFKYPEMKRTI